MIIDGNGDCVYGDENTKPYPYTLSTAIATPGNGYGSDACGYHIYIDNTANDGGIL